MNSVEMLMENNRAIIAVYKGLFDYLKTLADAKKIELTPKTPKLSSAPAELNTLAVMRFVGSQGVGTYVLGYSDANFAKIRQEYFPQPPIAPEAKTKTIDFEMMRHIYAALEPEFKAQKITVDPKNAVLQDGENLGDWQKFSAERTVQLPIGTPAGDLVFEIPLFNMEWVKQNQVEQYGFKPDTRIMVVDDSMVSRKHSRTCLNMTGYFNVEETADGDAALKKVMNSTPRFGLIVADWHMPNMSGFDMLKKFRAVDEFKKLPIIMVTGEKNKEEVIAAIKEGASGYLVKPMALPGFQKAMRKAGGRA